MTPEKLRAWLNRSREEAVKLRLSHVTLEANLMFRQWNVASFAEDIPVQAILDACADHADACAEEIRVLIEFVGEDGEVIASTHHKMLPLAAPSEHAFNAGSVTGNALIAQLLRHIEVQQRVMSSSHVHIQESYERTIANLHKDRERMAQQIQALTEAIASRAADDGEDENTPEARQEALARADAWSKVAEYAPTALSLVIQGVQAKMGGANGYTPPPPATGG